MKKIIGIFSALIIIFIVLLSYFLIPNSVINKRAMFPIMAILALVFFLLGIALVVFTMKEKVKGWLKKFLILTGACSAGFLVSVILHNFFYALGIITEHIIVLKYLFEVLHVAFFLIAIPICPIGFLVGAVGSIVLLTTSKKIRKKITNN